MLESLTKEHLDLLGSILDQVIECEKLCKQMKRIVTANSEQLNRGNREVAQKVAEITRPMMEEALDIAFDVMGKLGKIPPEVPNILDTARMAWSFILTVFACELWITGDAQLTREQLGAAENITNLPDGFHLPDRSGHVH